MNKPLYLKASPRIGRSYSVKVADTFVEAFKKNHPRCEILPVGLFERHLPSFDGLAVTAKYTILHGEKPYAEEMAKEF